MSMNHDGGRYSAVYMELIETMLQKNQKEMIFSNANTTASTYN